MKDLPDMKVEVTIEVKVPGDWLSFCTQGSDLLSTSYSGYWARGVERDDKLGWLLWEFEEDERLSNALEANNAQFLENLPIDAEDKLHTKALKAWRAGKKLPPHYHRLNQEAAVKGYLAMSKRNGLNWYEKTGDSLTYDAAIQLGTLDEVKYG